MISVRHIAAFTCMLALGACPPLPQPISLYNNSGQDLTLRFSQYDDVAWKSGEYLTFDPRGSHPAPRDPDTDASADSVVEITNAGGRYLRYVREDRPSALFSFINSGSYDLHPRVSLQPQYACDHLRIESDLAIYMIASRHSTSTRCGKIDVAGMTIPNQPYGFPLAEGDPPPSKPDSRSVYLDGREVEAAH